MLLNWVLFAVGGVVAYAGLSLMGQLSGGAAGTAIGAMVNLFKNPYALAALIAGNAVWAAALYYGLRETKLALPILFAIGDIVGFIYAVAFLSAEVTALRLAGLGLILVGIYFLA